MERNGWQGYYITAYGIAAKHGFKGTEKEWLESLIGYTPKRGVDYYTEEDKKEFLREIGEMAVLPHVHAVEDIHSVDEAETEGSENLITSGAVYRGIKALHKKIEDSTTENIAENSALAATSGAVYREIEKIKRGGLKVVTGTYTGDGYAGEAYKKEITVEGVDSVFLLIVQPEETFGIGEAVMLHGTKTCLVHYHVGTNQAGVRALALTWGGDPTVSWYTTAAETEGEEKRAAYQLNTSGATYRWYAIGMVNY